MPSVEERYKRAFDPPPRLDVGTITNVERQRINRFFRSNSVMLVSERLRLGSHFGAVLTDYYIQELTKIHNMMLTSGAWVNIIEDFVRLYNGLKTPSRRPRQVTKEIKEILKTTTTHQDLVLSEIRHVADGTAGLFSESEDILEIGRLLFAESGATFVKRQIESSVTGATVDITLLKEKVQKEEKFTAADVSFVTFTFGQPPIELLTAIIERKNRITAINLTDSMFEELRDVMIEELYAHPIGSSGAREVAREIVNEFGDVLGKTPKQIRDRAMLWARTEGVILQNDSLIKMGVDAGMDGKIWQNVGDSLVRTFISSNGDHVINDADGIIPMNATFSDGSTNGGSGSVSPWLCRCTVGPAMLPAKR